MKLLYNAIIRSFNTYTGETTKLTKVHNLIVDSGLEFTAKIMGGLTDPWTVIAIGTDDTAPVNGDTELNTEYDRDTATVSYEANYKLVLDKTFTVGSGVTESIKEAGIFDSAIILGSNMLNRLIFDAHTLNIDNPLEIIITITVARP
jgi:hypothetical protein